MTLQNYLCALACAFVSPLLAQQQILNEPLANGNLPAGWSQTNILFKTSGGGYSHFTDTNSVLTSPLLDLSSYTQVKLSFSVAKFGSGDDGPLTVEISNDGGMSWTAQTFDSPIPESGDFVVSGPTSINVTEEDVRIRFLRNGSPSDKRLKNILLTGTDTAMHDSLDGGGWRIDTIGTLFTVDFDNSIPGINNGQYANLGFAPSPVAGQLNSDGIRLKGLSDEDGEFGGTYEDGDFTRGSDPAGVGTGGMYAFEVNPGDYALGVQPIGSDFNPGSISIKLLNNTGRRIVKLEIGYDIYVNNDEGRSSSFNFSHSPDDVTYIDVPALNYASPLAAEDSSGFVKIQRNTTISSVNIEDGDHYYLQWSSEDIAGSGSRDEFALDNISVKASVDYTYIYENDSWNKDPAGIASRWDSILVKDSGASISENSECGFLIIEPGADLTLDGYTLNVSDTAILKADSSGYAQVTGDINGIAEVQAHLNNSSARFFNLAFPVTSTLSDISFDNTSFLRANGSANSNIYFFDAGSEDTDTKQGSWRAVTNLNEPANGRGYSVYIGAPDFGELPVILSAKGELVNGDQIVNTDYLVSSGGQESDNGWNYIPNPYPSSISWSALKNTNPNLEATYYIDNGDGTFAAHNGTAAVTGASGVSSHSKPATDLIAPMQSFFVKLSAAGHLNFSDSIRTLSHDPVKYKSSDNFIKLRVVNSINGAYDEVAIGFEPGLTDNVDKDFDGLKQMNNNPEVPDIYAHSAANAFALHGIADDFDLKRINVHFRSSVSGSYRIMGIVENTNPSWDFILEDKLTGTYTDLRRSVVEFDHNIQNSKGRFVLHISKTGTALNEREVEKVFSYIKDEVLYVKFKHYMGRAFLSLFDINGRLLQSKECPKTKDAHLNLQQLNSGMYIFKVVSSDGTALYSKKIIR